MEVLAFLPEGLVLGISASQLFLRHVVCRCDRLKPRDGRIPRCAGRSRSCHIRAINFIEVGASLGLAHYHPCQQQKLHDHKEGHREGPTISSSSLSPM
eukprot:CAMPEP_0178400866 /NCGR_PEP_ID=MMETSP0689_2-20121128/16008_1 /TAXON_ID=160604 /ORGANISM="Amphidinium massartii, Strain CS-259" /LENGTH=97 /DNA_ID=CAMNT_0020021671 /DNA_START=571 /DNA_END=864 /DNA_ORIENTATION=+